MANNRFIFPVGGTPESVRTQIGAVGPAPEPGTVPAPVVGEVLTWDGTAWVPGAGGGGGSVTNVTASSPLSSSGGATPNISINAGLAPNQVLTWNGTAWVSSASQGITQLTGDVTTVLGSGSQPATVARLQGNAVSSVAPSDGQVLTWNGSAWVPGAPASGGSGGGGQVYFLNAGTAAQAPTTNLPGTPKELGLTAEAGASTITSGALPAAGFLRFAGFVTQLNKPNLDAVPAGVWDFNVWASASPLTPNTVSFRLKVYSYDGTNPPTLLATGAATPIYDPSQTVQYVSSVVLPQTAILTTDRIYVEIEGSSTSGSDTITVSFGGSTPSHGHTTLPSVAGTGIVHVINGVVQSPAGPVDLTAGATEISGTLPIGNGGTGVATTPTDGQLLIGKTSTNDYTLTTLTQGSNVTITNGAGSITIDAVGSIAGTIAANEIAFGTGADTIGGSPLFTADSTAKTVTLTGDANPVLVLVDELSGTSFVEAYPQTREIAVLSDPPGDSATINPTDVAVGNGSQSGNVKAGYVGAKDTGTGNEVSLTLPGAVATLTSVDGASNPFPLNLVIEELQVNSNPGNAGEVLTSNGPNAAPTWQAGGGGGGAVYAGALTVYVDPTNGTDAPGNGTLAAPYASINYAYSQVPSLGAPANVAYNANVGRFVSEKLIFQLAPGRYAGDAGQATGTQSATTLQDTTKSWRVNEFAGGTVTLTGGTGVNQTATVVSNTADTLTVSAPWATTPVAGSTNYTVTTNVTLGFKRARVQLIGNGVQIVGNVTMRAVRADFPAADMQALRARFPAPWTNAGSQVTFEITGGGLGGGGGGVEADSTADPLVVTGLTTLLFDEPTFAGAGLAPNWDTNYGQFNYYANKAYLIGGMVMATSYTVPTTNGLPVSVIEIDASTIGEAGIPYRSYLGAVPYAYVTNTVGWNTGTGVATGAGQSTTALQDTTKTWTPGQWIGATLNLTTGTGAGQTATVTGNTSNTLTFAALVTAPVTASTTYSLVGTTNKAPTGTITLKCHNSTIGGAIGPRLTLGEIDGCRVYDIDRTMLGTVDNGGVTGSTSTSYLGLVINQFRQYSGTGYPASQYQLGASTGTTRYKLDSTSYTTLAFNRSGAGVLTARTLNLGGGVSFDFQDESRSLAYTPTTPANWLDPDPTTVGSALDKVATTGLLAAAPTNGQIPIGNGTGFTLATLTAGPSVTITNAAGSVTVVGNLSPLGSVGATPTAANLRTNATYTVNVAAVALPAMAVGDDGITISLINITAGNVTVTPSTGVARTMSAGGGQMWVWRNANTTWYCTGNV